ncbi:MAG: mechanosensitive ion channel [Bifidobacteriaceae bacterium]|jgi:small-conductance mechanosensitive channel|nr:mechanosensitive ion channel [Bifidobacteriaceae bacterium]
MPSVFEENWLIGAIAFAVGLPVLFVALTELGGWLARRHSPVARPVVLLRNWVLPVGALAALLAFALQQPTQNVWMKVIVTVLGFLAILLVLSALNVALFSTAKAGSWRGRVPSIFVDLFRLLLIAVALAVLFSLVWNANVTGLFAALGVTSIVIGLALQGAVGGVISGLLLLFEQPFQLGDWLDSATAKGKVIEVNWRAVHLFTATGTQVVPNSVLAAGWLTNMSRTLPAYRVAVTVFFDMEDSPVECKRVLLETAQRLPWLHPEGVVDLEFKGGGCYEVGLPLESLLVGKKAQDQFQTWLWYATRRAGLRLDAIPIDRRAEAKVLNRALKKIGPGFNLTKEGRDALAKECRIEVYGPDEVVQDKDVLPEAFRFVLEGELSEGVTAPDGERQEWLRVREGEFIGMGAFSHEVSLAETRAVGVASVLVMPLSSIDRLLKGDPVVSRTLGDTIERRRTQLAAAAH